MQKAFILTMRSPQTGFSSTNLNGFNQLLKDGWRVVSVTPMGGAGGAGDNEQFPSSFAAVVIIERAREEKVGGSEQTGDD
jgi:hypothetical protein